MSLNKKLQLKFGGIILLALVAGLISYPQAAKKVPPVYNALSKLKINLGLDLQGGIHLEYKADVSNIDSDKVASAMEGAQTVIERRVNAFGVGEPLVQAARSGSEYRIVVELPGIKNIEEAKQKIKDAPLLEFKEEGEVDPQIAQMFVQANQQTKQKAQEILDKAKKGEDFAQLAKDNSQDPSSKDNGGDLDFIKKPSLYGDVFDSVAFGGKLKPGEVSLDLVETDFGWEIIKFIESRGEGENLEVHVAHILFAKQSAEQYPQFRYKETGLTGKNLKNAQAEFSQQGVGEPQVLLTFDDEGTKLFAEITKRNLGKKVAIFLDGEIQMEPTVQAEITNGQAVITGSYTAKQAQDIAKRLNEGALPVPLTLIGQKSVEATLGADSLKSIIEAGAIGLGAVIVFMLVFYRFLGLVASFALLIYTALMVSIFKFSGITLTLSGIAGFVLSIGMAVDANILIFERTKEEIRNGKSIHGALKEGFKRAWTSIFDGNMSTILTSLILYLLGTGFVKGFAAALGIGVVVSMFTAIVITRTMLNFIIREWFHEKSWLVGVRKKDIQE